ncbi:MAG: hydrocarbon-binding protein [Prochloraceae cyanobacterium]
MRQELGSFSSIICLKAVIVGVEEALGEKAGAIATIAAGRKRGKELARSLGFDENSLLTNSIQVLTSKASYALGKEGTRLCIIERITEIGNKYRVYVRETVESDGEPPQSSRKCTYTLGAIQGFLEACLGKRLRGKQVASAVNNERYDIFEYIILAPKKCH